MKKHLIIAGIIWVIFMSVNIKLAFADENYEALSGLRYVAQDQMGEKQQKILLLAAYAVIDYQQSAGWVTPGGTAVELNPLLGDHPERRDMLIFGVVGMSSLLIVSEIAPDPWATIIIDSALSSELFNIEDNVRVKEGQRRRINAVPIIVTFRF